MLQTPPVLSQLLQVMAEAASGLLARRCRVGATQRVAKRPLCSYTEVVNNVMKRIKRVGFGFRSFVHYRVRVLLCAGRPNWDQLLTLTPR